MKTVRIFNCRIRRKHRDSMGDGFELVREFVAGEDDVLLQGTYLTCRDAMNRYYMKLIQDPERFVVQWCDEFGFMVHQLLEVSPTQNQGQKAG